MSLNYNRVCNLEDFNDPDLVSLIRDIFRHELKRFPTLPTSVEYRKHWEIAMSVRALRDFGVLREDAEVLGIGAGTETTIFYLTNFVKRVIATDLYLNPADWEASAPRFMLYEPEKVAPYPFRLDHLIVQHMSGLDLRYADNTFDGIFSSGSIEHFGSWENIALAAAEMGRVLKPGGILTLSTEYLIKGPDGGFDGLRLFDETRLKQHVVAASRCELVDEFVGDLSSETLATNWDLQLYEKDRLSQIKKDAKYPSVNEVRWSHYPHLVINLDQYQFCSVHLTLQKTENYHQAIQKPAFEFKAPEQLEIQEQPMKFRKHLRIGIEYRLIEQAITRNRGMGRYTQNQLREVLKVDKENEYWLYCYENANPDFILPEIRENPQVRIRYVIPYASLIEQSVDALSRAFQSTLQRDEIDLFHATTVFFMRDLAFTNFTICPLIATHYDLIPLIYPDEYLSNKPVRRLYEYVAQSHATSDALIAISNAVRDEAIKVLGFDTDRIEVAYPIPAPVFKVIPPEKARFYLNNVKLNAGIHIPDRFVLSVPGLHHSKNVETLLHAYSLLPETTRREYPLVFTFELSPDIKNTLFSIARKYAIEDNLLLTGFISDEELVAIYNAATVYVHPSRYEGFGLPVVEALKCGTPVITTTAASLPEAGGNAAILVDPEDAQAMSDAILRVLSDADLREQMRQRGLAHAELFTGDQLALNTLKGYGSALAHFRRERLKNARIAFWTPMPPQRSGIADYSKELLDHLTEYYEIDIYVSDDYVIPPVSPSTYRIFKHTEFEARNSANPYILNIYQMGASAFHNYIYDHALLHAGIIVIHDLAMSLVLFARTVQSGDQEKFFDEFVYSEGEKNLDELNQLMLDLTLENLRNFARKFPMLRRLLEGSVAQIVHMPAAQEEIETRYHASNVHTVLEGVGDLTLGAHESNESVRQRLNVSKDTFLIGVFGIVDSVKQIDVILRSVEKLSKQFPDVRLLIVGEIPILHYEQELKILISHLKLQDKVILAGYVEEKEFKSLLWAIDVFVGLRYPAMMQMSATIMRAIGAGKPLIISDIPEWRYLPETFCWFVDPLDTEGNQLTEYLKQLVADSELRKERGQQARTYYERELTISKMASRYVDIIDHYAIQIERLATIPATENGATVEDIMPDSNISARSISSESRTYQLARYWYSIWNSLRLKQDIRGRGTKLAEIPGIGFVYKTILRIRNLGKVWGAEAELLQHMLDYTANLASHLQALEQQNAQASAAWAEEHSRLQNKITALEKRLQNLVTEVTYPIPPVDLLKRIEALVPQLADTKKVDLALVGSNQDIYIADLIAYIQDRHELFYPEIYYQFDFDFNWEKRIDFKVHAERLRAPAYLVLITDASFRTQIFSVDFDLIQEQILDFEDQAVAVYIWQRRTDT